MESPSLAKRSVSANVSEFARAELEAFVAASKLQRPSAWSRVEELQRVCRAPSQEQAMSSTSSEPVGA